MAETTSTLSPNLHTFYQKVLLTSAQSNLKLRQFADEKVQPKGTGLDYYMLRYGNLASNVAPLTEAVTPTASTIDTNKYTVSILEYGEYIPISTLLEMAAIDPVIESISDRMGYQAARTIDTIISNTLIANATNNAYYINARAADVNVVAGDTFTAADAVKGVALLKGQDAPLLSDGSYAWVMHPYNSMDIQADTSAGGFIELNKYVDGLAGKVLAGEVGKVYGARVVESSNIVRLANAGTIGVYRTFLLAQKAFAMTKFNQDAVEIITKQAGSAGTSDPLNQISTVGYKMRFGLKYLGGSFTNANNASPDLCIQIRGTSTNN